MVNLPDHPNLNLHAVSGRVHTTVTQADTAQSVGSGDVPVLGTPRVLALAEAAAVMAVTRHLPTALTTVGSRVDLRHRRAIALGDTVFAMAALRVQDGKRLVFDFKVLDQDDRLVADGEIERVLTDRDEFMAAVRQSEGDDH